MPLVPRLRSTFGNLFGRRRREAELDAELRAVLDQLTDEKIAAGLSPEVARRAAQVELGGVEQVKEEVRAVRAGAWLATFGQDLRYGLRSIVRNRGLSAVVVVTIGLGIGANTAIFSVVNALLLKPLPAVADPGRLVWFRSATSYPNFLEYRDALDVFSGIAAMGGSESFALKGERGAELVTGELVTAAYFDVLGVRPALGRGFVVEDDRPAAAPVAVLADALWRRRFGADPAIVGRTIRVNGIDVRVAGVAPPHFIGAEVGLPRDLWLPMGLRPRLVAADGERAAEIGNRLQERRFHWLNVVARLGDGVGLEQGQAQAVAVAARVAAAHHDPDATLRVRGATLLPVVGGLDPRDRLEAVTVAAFLMVLVAMVLLVACANVAGLLLARALTRVKEMGIRRALGATRLRLVRQLLTESLVLALLGGAVGLLWSVWANHLLVRLASVTPIAPPDLSLDPLVLGFTVALSVATALLFGLAPAIQASRADVMAALKNDRGAAGGGRASRLRRGLVVVQVALSLVFLVGAGLVGRGLADARAVDPGFVVENGWTVAVSPRSLRYTEADGQRLYRDLLAGVTALPGVEAASLVRMVPFGLSAAEGAVAAEGRDDLVPVGFNVVGPGYFRTMGIALVRGRDLTSEDAAGGAAVAVVNESLARRLFPDADAIGKRVRFGAAAPAMEIVGVAADSKTTSLGERERPFLYRPLYQSYEGAMTLVVRASGPAAEIGEAVRRRIQAVDEELPISELESLAQHVDFALLPARLCATLLAAFGLLALGLAMIGLFGLVSTAVRQRTHEIGVRMALGASRADILALVVREGTVVVAVGLVLGFGLALASTRFISSLLHGTSPGDPVTFAAVSALLLLVAVVASYVPARRATRLDPMASLRAE